MKHCKKKILWNDLENNWLKGNFKIIVTIIVAYTLIEHQE